ncbi:MAG TPA: phage major capsid protein [Paracoccus sp. (in: a-proteobacteria)]|uniref:phage major capsid protein n=1 Tax=Paracoccus sp. TaxID=267 RepID=UPI002CD0A25F|nr:phage major capsid protein [Paracoccus sp. (in: a-proteobacteria)]HWL56405.1 phage major capsid protein [Paracoccus sp. (in: a-proteobacteria)]
MDRIESKAAFSVDDEGRIEGLASVFGTVDRGGDVVHKGAFAGASFPIPMLAGHDQAEVIGVWQEGVETPAGLAVKGQLTLSVQRAREIRDLILAKAIQGLSIGYQATRKAARRGGGRDLHAVDLLEISVVAVPMHPGARITSAKDMTMTEQTEDQGIAALEAKMTEIEKKADTAPIIARLDKLEAKMNRPATEKAEDQPDEQKTAFVEYLRSGKVEGKALTTASDTANHILAPEQVESEFIRNLVEYSPIRQIADVRSTTAAKVILPQRTSVTNAVWVGETTARTGSEPGFDQADLDVKELATFVDLSLQLAEDSANVLSEVNLALAEDFGQKESAAFVNGALALEPSGFMANADIVTTDNGHAANVSPDALIALMYALPATYRQAGTWVMNGTTLGVIRTLKDGDGRYLWQPSYQAGQPETILGRPVVEAVDMPDIAADAEPIIFGDFKRGYRIYDRLSLSVLADPYSVRVNGLMRYHARRRVGAGVVRPTAFRKLAMVV